LLGDGERNPPVGNMRMVQQWKPCER